MKPEYLDPLTGIWGKDLKSATESTVSTAMFHSNYGSILLSFPDMTAGRTTDGQIDVGKITYIWPTTQTTKTKQKKASNAQYVS